MVLPLLSITLIVATLGTIIALNSTVFGPNSNLSLPFRPVSSNVHVDPIPNPYPIPGTPLSLLFYEHQDALIERDVRLCIKKARVATMVHIRDHGDGPIPMGVTKFKYRRAGIWIEPTQLPSPPLTYNHTLVALHGLSTKLDREGYWHWVAEIFQTEGNILMGDILVSDHQ